MAEPFPVAWLDGRLLPLAEARVSPLDRAYLFGDGVYEVMPVYGGRVYLFDAHFDRLDRSLRELRMPAPCTRDAWRNLCGALVAANGSGEMYLYVQVSRGAESGRNHLPLAELVPRVFAFAAPLPPAPTPEDAGVACVTLEDNRWGRCDIKSTALLANVMLKWQARDAGASEALLVRSDRLIEGGSSSVLVALDGGLVTPPDSRERLPGTTREVIVELARRAGIATTRREIAVAELRRASEIWTSAAVLGLRPVTTLDHAPVGDGRPGPAYRRVRALFEATRAEFSTECRP